MRLSLWNGLTPDQEKIPNEVSTLAKIMLRCNNVPAIAARKGAERVEASEGMMRSRCLAGPALAA
jgi:hypothetical protein